MTNNFILFSPLSIPHITIRLYLHDVDSSLPRAAADDRTSRARVKPSPCASRDLIKAWLIALDARQPSFAPLARILCGVLATWWSVSPVADKISQIRYTICDSLISPRYIYICTCPWRNYFGAQDAGSKWTRVRGDGERQSEREVKQKYRAGCSPRNCVSSRGRRGGNLRLIRGRANGFFRKSRETDRSVFRSVPTALEKEIFRDKVSK